MLKTLSSGDLRVYPQRAIDLYPVAVVQHLRRRYALAPYAQHQWAVLQGFKFFTDTALRKRLRDGGAILKL